jgi:hypothetical protein
VSLVVWVSIFLKKKVVLVSPLNFSFWCLFKSQEKGKFLESADRFGRTVDPLSMTTTAPRSNASNTVAYSLALRHGGVT